VLAFLNGHPPPHHVVWFESRLSTPDPVGGVQNIQVHVSTVLSVSVRFYADQDRRIVSSWQFVPVYSQEIASSFTAMRTVREYAP